MTRVISCMLSLYCKSILFQSTVKAINSKSKTVFRVNNVRKKKTNKVNTVSIVDPVEESAIVESSLNKVESIDDDTTFPVLYVAVVFG